VFIIRVNFFLLVTNYRIFPHRLLCHSLVRSERYSAVARSRFRVSGSVLATVNS